jgi:hypothetical protein
MSHTQCIPCIDNFFTILCITWMIRQGEGGTSLLTVVTEVMSVGQRTAIPCKMEKTGWAAGLDSVQSREKEKGAARAAHRRLKVRAAAGVGGEAGRSRGEIRQCRPKLWERLVWRRSAVVAERCRWPVWKRLARTTDVEEVGGGGRAASVAGV